MLRWYPVYSCSKLCPPAGEAVGANLPSLSPFNRDRHQARETNCPKPRFTAKHLAVTKRERSSRERSRDEFDGLLRAYTPRPAGLTVELNQCLIRAGMDAGE